MDTIIIYISNNENNSQNDINKSLIEKNFTNIKKIYSNNFNYDNLKGILDEYKYLIYLDDKTNYNYNNIKNDIDEGLNILNNNKNIQQILFYNYIYNDINENILEQNKTYLIDEINILKERKFKKDYNINYKKYVDDNFNRLFMPSIIRTSLFKNYKEKLTNILFYELNFLKKNNIVRKILDNAKNYIFEKEKIKENINDDLTIVTGFIKLNEKKIHKYEFQKYEYIEKCIDTLKMNINMVIYISEELYDFVYKKRKEFNLLNKTKIIVVDIENYMYFYDKLNIIKENVKKNHINYSNAMKILSVVSRYNYLKDTIKNNYFETNYIAWLDFSASHIVSIPENIIFKDNFNNRIRIGWIARYNNKFKYNYKVLAGGFFIGKNELMLELIKLHNYYFNLLMNYGYTINDDKILFYIFESNPYLFKTYFTDYKHLILKL